MKAAVKAAEREQKKKAAEAGLNIGKCAKAIYKDSFETAKEAKGKGFYGAYGSCMKPATDVLALLSKGKDPAPIQNNITIDIKPVAIDDILAEYYGSKPDKSSDTEGNGIRQPVHPTQTDSETSRVPDEPKT
jgi:hypothetical protein